MSRVAARMDTASSTSSSASEVTYRSDSTASTASKASTASRSASTASQQNNGRPPPQTAAAAPPRMPSNASSRASSRAPSNVGGALPPTQSQQNMDTRSRTMSHSSQASHASHASAGLPRSRSATSSHASKDLARVDTHTLGLAAKQAGGLAAVPSFYGIRSRSQSSWSVLPENEHKPGLELTLKEPSFRFTVYGKSWAHDLVALPANAVRAEMKDFYGMLWLCMRRGSYLSATDLTEFYSWFHEFAMFLEIWLQCEDHVFYPWALARVDETGLDVPELLQNEKRMIEFNEIMQLVVKIEESNVLFSLRPPEICLMAIASVVDVMTNRLMRYLITKEEFVPELLLETYEKDQKLAMEQRTATFMQGMPVFPHGLAFIARGFKHPGEVNAWTHKMLNEKQQTEFKSSRKWLQTVHLQRVELQNERLKIFGDMSIIDETHSDPARSELPNSNNSGSRVNSFYSQSAMQSLAGSKANSMANSRIASRQLSKANQSRQASNVSQTGGAGAGGDDDAAAMLAAEGAAIAAGGSRSGSRQPSNVVPGSSSRQASNVPQDQAGFLASEGAVIAASGSKSGSKASSRQPSNVQQQQSSSSRQASNVSQRSQKSAGGGMNGAVAPGQSSRQGSNVNQTPGGSRSASNASASRQSGQLAPGTVASAAAVSAVTASAATAGRQQQSQGRIVEYVVTPSKSEPMAPAAPPAPAPASSAAAAAAAAPRPTATASRAAAPTVGASAAGAPKPPAGGQARMASTSSDASYATASEASEASSRMTSTASSEYSVSDAW